MTVQHIIIFRNPITVLKNSGVEMSLQIKEECVVSSGDIIKLEQQKYIVTYDESDEMDNNRTLKQTAKTSSKEKVKLIHFYLFFSEFFWTFHFVFVNYGLKK